MVSDALYSKKSDEWCTPKDLFDKLNKEFNFDLDAAALQENTLCTHYYSLNNSAPFPSMLVYFL